MTVYFDMTIRGNCTFSPGRKQALVCLRWLALLIIDDDGALH